MKIDITKLPQNEAGEWLIKTRDGRQAFIRTDKANPPYCIHGRIEDGDEDGTWTLEGDFDVLWRVSADDLIMPEPWKLGRSVNGFTLGEGQEWVKAPEGHEWTEDDLPKGYRPLLAYPANDCGQYESRGPHSKYWNQFFDCQRLSESTSNEPHAFWRTRRPLPEAIDAAMKGEK